MGFNIFKMANIKIEDLLFNTACFWHPCRIN
jgi:hypothetical protein